MKVGTLRSAIARAPASYALIAVAVALAATVAVFLVSQGGEETRLSSEPEAIAHGAEIYSFQDPAIMAVTADLVIRGEVTLIEPGRTVLPGEPESFQYRAVTIEVDEVLRSADGSNPARVILEEQGYWPNGDGFMVEGITWSEVGDEGFYFLSNPSDSDGYHLVNSQGRVLIGGGGLEPSGATPLSSLAAMNTEQLVSLVEQAAADLDAGRLTPQSPMSH